MRDFIWAMFHPMYWIQNYEYSETLDSFLNKCMEEDWDVQFFQHTVKVTNKQEVTFELWSSNHPYASYTLYNYFNESKFLAKRRTRHKFRQWLVRKQESVLLEKFGVKNDKI